jgi:hypothetical protein
MNEFHSDALYLYNSIDSSLIFYTIESSLGPNDSVGTFSGDITIPSSAFSNML